MSGDDMAFGHAQEEYDPDQPGGDLDDNEREAIGELLGELDMLRAGKYPFVGSVGNVDMAFMAEIAGRSATLIDRLLEMVDR